MLVDVYRNLHTGGLTVRYQGRVLLHTDAVWLCDVDYVVSPAGRERVLREKRKNVHAYARGELAVPQDPYALIDAVAVTYNPYKCGSFYDRITEEAVKSAAWARITAKGITSFGTVYTKEQS